MKVPILQQYNRADFPDAPDWITKLLYPLQLFQSFVVQALTSQLSLQDNISCVINTQTITAGATDVANATSFQWTLGRQPVILTVHAQRTDGTNEIIYPQASWLLGNNAITINAVTGLTNGKQYTLTFLVI